jgi:hypothetical protein
VLDEELKAAHHKVQIARKIVTEDRIAYALGRCLPEHLAHWHGWSQREDFMKWVQFDARNITSFRTTEEIGVRRIEVTRNDFTFRDRPYRLVFRDSGLSSTPGDNTYRGEVHFFSGETCVAKLSCRLAVNRGLPQFVWLTDVSNEAATGWHANEIEMVARSGH